MLFLPLYFPLPCSVRNFPRSPDGRIRRSWVMLHCGHDIPSQRCDPASISNGRPRVGKRSYVRLTARDRQLVAWVRIHRGGRGREELGKWCGRICECTPYLTFQFFHHFANKKAKARGPSSWTKREAFLCRLGTAAVAALAAKQTDKPTGGARRCDEELCLKKCNLRSCRHQFGRANMSADAQ